MAFDVYSYVTPAAGLKAGDAFTLPYAAGRTVSKYLAAGAHFALGPNAMLVTAPAKFTVAFNGPSIAVTWQGATVAPATTVKFQFATVDGPIGRDGKEQAHANADNLDLSGLALQPTNSPAFTGTPTAPTAAPGTNTTQISTTAFVAAAIAALINSSPAALDTLNELATALGDDANFAATMTAALALKAPLASPALTGTPTAPTAAPGTNTTQLATAAFVLANLPAALTIAQLLVGTDAAKFATAAALFGSAAPVANAATGGTVTLDLSAGSNVDLAALASNLTLANPSGGMTPGRSGRIRLVQDATGGRTITYGTQWTSVSGAAEPLGAVASKTTYLFYYVRSATEIEYSVVRSA